LSGGSWDYIYFKFEEGGFRLLNEKCPYRKALGKIVIDIAKAMHDIEWVDSCDKSSGDELEAIKKVVRKEDVLKVVIEEAKRVQKELTQLLQNM